MQLKDKVAIVTGSSRGIGKGIAKAYGEEGAKVVVVARTDEDGGRLPGTIHQTVSEIEAAGGEALAVKCDVTEEEDVQALVKTVMDTYGRIDVLVNNAGITLRTTIKDSETRRFQLIQRVNLLAPFLLSKYVLPVMEQQKSGSIINISSGAAGSRNGRGGSPYAITKYGLEQMSIGLAEETREHNIAVNALDPGGILTEGVRATRPADFDFSGYTPPEAVGPAVVALALKTAETLTGQVVKRAEYGDTWK